MQFSLDDRTCELGVGEFAGFTLGPRDAGAGGPAGVWRAQLGQQWHARLRAEVEREVTAQPAATAAFEVPLTLGYVHRGWRITFTGRIDQLVTAAGAVLVREIKTVAGPLPAEVAALRADYPDYFVQVLTYLALLRVASRSVEGRGSRAESEPVLPSTFDPRLSSLRAELVFVEIGSGLAQTVALTVDDEVLFRAQLERLVEFLNLRLQARERLRHLRFRPAFAALRPGQETVQKDLAAAFGDVGNRIPDTGKPSEMRLASPLSGIRNPVSPILFEAPTGYGKTGVLLEFALDRLRDGRFSRLLYLTGKSTGQLQVMRTLAAMTAPDAVVESRESTVEGSLSYRSTLDPRPSAARQATPVAAWQVRPKSEHCVNQVFHCVRDVCPFLADLETRWPQSGLARFYLRDDQPRELEALRAAGREARICPYEITRAALPFNDVWIGDYNYVFAPDSRGVFYERPGFNPAETLLVIDEAHNLPARVADAWSHVARARDAESVLSELHHERAHVSLVLAWEQWTRLLASLPHAESLDPMVESEVREAVENLATLVAVTPLDYGALGPRVAEELWQTLALRDWFAGDFALPPVSASPLSDSQPARRPVRHSFSDGGSLGAGGYPESDISTLLWCPRAGELHFTVLDAPGLIGPTLRSFGGVILASATLQPAEVFAAACGLADRGDGIPDTGKKPEAPAALGRLSRRARRTLREVTSGAVLLQLEETREAARPRLLQARAPWRDHAYLVGVDARVDTTFQHRAHHFAATAATVEALQGAAGRAVAVFFPSYAYADHIARALETTGSNLRAALQPRAADLATQTAWVEESLARADALFLVLGSSFAESIDLLGGRVTHAMVVGPALPEVNAMQRTRLAALARAGLSRDAAFRRVYQIPGMQKVNQALGRLVRAPGQRARILLHCRRFAEPSYAALLAPEYRRGEVIATDEEFIAWLAA
jgi:Rad3-related DNA helicase